MFLAKKYRLFGNLSAPLIVIVLCLALETWVELRWGMRIVAPILVVVLITINFFATFPSAFLSSVLAWIYTAFILPKHLPAYTDADAFVRAAAWGVSMMGLTIMISFLRRRSEEGLRAQVKKNLEISEALKVSEERTRALIDLASDAFIGMDQLGRITDWNRKAESIFGWRTADVLGKTLSDIIIPSRYREAHRKGLERYLQSGEAAIFHRPIEVTALNRQGTELPIELTIYPIAQPEGVAFGSFLKDITAQKQEALVQSLQMEVKDILSKIDSMEEAFPLLLRQICQIMKWSSAEIWLEDARHETLIYKAGWAGDPERLLRYQQANFSLVSDGQDQVIGRVWAMGKSWWIEDLSEVATWSRYAELKELGYQSAFVMPLLAAGHRSTGALIFFDTKKMTLDPRLSDVMSEMGTYIGLFVQRKQAKETLARLYQELELKVEERTRDLAVAYEQAQTANRLKDEFLATVSHELRTPLNVILGHAELLLEEELTPEEIHEGHETIYRNAKNQMQIISDLLDISRIVMGKMQLDISNVDLVEATKMALQSMELSASAKDIAIHFHCEEDLGLVRGDATRIQQILWNLLSNAVKFTPKFGRIDVDVRTVGSMIQIKVSDSGKGIEPEFLPYVFDRFRQEDASTTRRYGGLGLGLAIVKNIVDAHGGSVHADSKGPGQGSQFSVLLPLAALKGRVDFEQDLDSSFSPLTGKKIIVVEDDADTRKLLGLVLKRSGAKVTLVASADEALTLFKADPPQLILSDISMPDKNGYELILELRSLPPEQGGLVPAIALTSHARQEEIERAYKAGFNLHLPKPVDPRELLDRLSQFARDID